MKNTTCRLIAALVGFVIAATALAHETDQFTLPEGREFADLGRYLNEWAYTAIERGVEKVNRRIAERRSTPSARNASAAVDEIVAAVNSEFGAAYDVIEGFERKLNADDLKLRYPGKVTCYKDQFVNIYQHTHFILDPRQIFRLWLASTFNAYGTYMGTDKLGHFTDMGMHYYKGFMEARRAGASDDAAFKAAVDIGTDGPVFSERGMVGYLSAGDYSNADLAANFLGLLFYLNLTEPVKIKGQMQPPLLLRDGEFWKIAPHVRRDSDFFAIFICDHLDEGLNPGLFESGMRKPLRDAVLERASAILNRRCDSHGNRRTKAYFDAMLNATMTYYGQDYGHDGQYDELVSIGSTCFESLPPDANPSARDAYGNTPLHLAAATGELNAVIRLIQRGADVNARVRSNERYSPEWGNTPLHYAARDGRADVAEYLLAHGADVNAANDRGVTPLHRALAYPALTTLLLSKGARPNAIDIHGETPVHWAAQDGQAESIEILISQGGNVRVRNDAGFTPLHFACTLDDPTVAVKLLDHGADVNARTDLGVSPLQVAAADRNIALADLLVSRGADVRMRDQFGWTALHDAAAQGADDIASLLISRGADVNSANVHRTTPLHLAARNRSIAVASLLVQRGAKVNNQDELGMTALHEAARAGDRTIAAMLLQAGAQRSVKNAQGQTAVQLASSQNNSELLAVLRQTANASTAKDAAHRSTSLSATP